MESKSVEKTEIGSHRPEKEVIGNRTIRKSAIDPAVIIFLLTIVGYGSAALYERGYRRFYKIPNELMELNSSMIASSLISIGIIMMISVIMSLIFYTERAKDLVDKFSGKYLLKKESKNGITEYKLNKFSKIYGIISVIILGGLAVIDLTIFLGLLAIILLMVSVFFISINRIIPSVFLFIAMFAVLFYDAGYIQAKTKTEYLVIKKENLIVVDYYKDKAIVVKVDFEKRIIYPEYQFIKLESSEKSEQKLELKYTGTMKMSRTR